MKQKFRVGDRVYPINRSSINELKGEEVDARNFVGIVTKVDTEWEECDYCVAWLDAERVHLISNLYEAWWDESYLTDDRDKFLKRYDEHEYDEDFDECEDFDEDEEDED